MIVANKTSHLPSEKLRFIDLFAGAGGLSEGFIRAGFTPVAHVEQDTAACYSLRTRHAYHWLKSHNSLEIYAKYLQKKISRRDLYDAVPEKITRSVINKGISKESITHLFNQIDELLNGHPLDLIVGGPPCQAYSIVGRSRDHQRMLGDERNYLFTYYAEFLQRYRPQYFVFENVLGLLSAKAANGERYLDQMIGLFKACGYESEYQVHSAEDFAVPQRRKRIILIGRRGSKSGFYPSMPKLSAGTTIRQLFSDLPKIKAGEGQLGPTTVKSSRCDYLYEANIADDFLPVTLHSARPHTDQDLHIYRIAVKKWNKSQERLDYNSLPHKLKSHQNRDSFLDRFKVVAGDSGSSHTVVAHIAKDGHYYIHFDLKQNRSITPREAARIQTFPDNYFFESISERTGRTAAFKQVGNAVPVKMAEIIAYELKESWQ